MRTSELLKHCQDMLEAHPEDPEIVFSGDDSLFHVKNKMGWFKALDRAALAILYEAGYTER